MKKLFKLLTLDKEFIFYGKSEDLKEALKSSKDLRYNILSESEIEFRSAISFGTLSIGGFSLGIQVRALFVSLGPDRLKINFRTNVRLEHYALLVLFILLLIGMILNGEFRWPLLYVFGFWITAHCWFQFICRLQEDHLADKVVKRLRLLPCSYGGDK